MSENYQKEQADAYLEAARKLLKDSENQDRFNQAKAYFQKAVETDCSAITLANYAHFLHFYFHDFHQAEFTLVHGD
ncbi:MAG: hypothetical protein LBR25_07675 [Erysipelotrichaceae bacterium]|jgi:hypothetical protein|nr:hypothetical protein [Erysipelotrichaceae bacterium]